MAAVRADGFLTFCADRRFLRPLSKASVLLFPCFFFFKVVASRCMFSKVLDLGRVLVALFFWCMFVRF